MKAHIYVQLCERNTYQDSLYLCASNLFNSCYLLLGPFPVGEKQNKLHGMDTQILIDALAVIMGHEEKELCKPGNLALVLILDTASTILGSKERVKSRLKSLHLSH